LAEEAELSILTGCPIWLERQERVSTQIYDRAGGNPPSSLIPPRMFGGARLNIASLQPGESKIWPDKALNIASILFSIAKKSSEPSLGQTFDSIDAVFR
jgi:hypothetical protein